MSIRSILAWRPGHAPSARAVGITAILVFAIVAVGLYSKASITTALRGGDTIAADFEQNYQLVPDKTKVKFAGLEVGVVTDVRDTESGLVRVEMKVDDGVLDSLGPQPSAVIAPKTLLGGEYAVELSPGGGEGATPEVIPASRTQVPTELDRILEALPRPTRASLQGTVAQLDRSLRRDGSEALGELVEDVPKPFRDGGEVLVAMRGHRPDTDLSNLIKGVDSLATVLHDQRWELGSIVERGRITTEVLTRRSPELGAALDELPATLTTTRTGMVALRDTLAELRRTAPLLRPATEELAPLLEDLEPTLIKARPLVRQLRPLVRQLRPAVDGLVPIVDRTEQVLSDVRGPVIDRVNGPILDVVMNTWRGTGPYSNSGGGVQGDHTFYEELAYMVTNLDRASMTQDSQGSLLSFQVGVSAGTLAGIPLNLPHLLEQLGLPGGY